VLSSLKLRETGKIQFRFHIKPFMVRKQGKEKETSVLIEHHAAFLISFITLGEFFVFLEKRGYFMLRQKSNHLLKCSLF